jgi:hypothetical protein
VTKALAKTKPRKKPKGREETFTQEIADKICDLIAGGMTLTEACKSPGMPSRRTVQRWCQRHPEFDSQYRRAQELLADALFDEIKAIADDGTGDFTIDAKGKQRVDWENVNRSKLRVETRKWLAAQLNPRKYGDKVLAAAQHPAEIERKEPPLSISQLASALDKMLGVSEQQAGLPSGEGRSNQERVDIIRNANDGVLSPELYASLYAAERGEHDNLH